MSLRNIEEPRAGRLDSSDRYAAGNKHLSTPSNNNARSFETSAAQNQQALEDFTPSNLLNNKNFIHGLNDSVGQSSEISYNQSSQIY